MFSTKLFELLLNLGTDWKVCDVKVDFLVNHCSLPEFRSCLELASRYILICHDGGDYGEDYIIFQVK